MRERTHFGRALQAARNSSGLTLEGLAELSGISHPAIHRIENYARRPDVETLRALVSSWPEAITRARILIEHLRDEVQRAGQPDGSITMHPSGTPSESAAVHNLALIHMRAPSVAEHIDALLSAFAELVMDDPEAGAMIAAEPPPPVEYMATTKRAKRTKPA